MTAKEMAKMFGVSVRTIEHIRRLNREAPADVMEKIRSGELGISQAVKQLGWKPTTVACTLDEGELELFNLCKELHALSTSELVRRCIMEHIKRVLDDDDDSDEDLLNELNH